MQPVLQTRTLQVLVAVLSVALLILAASCGSDSDKNQRLAEQGVIQFHSQLDAEQFHALYTGADAGLRKVTSETDFVALMQAVHQKLGKVQQSRPRTYQVAWFVGEGTRVTLIYETRFSMGTGTEQFMWHVRDNRPLLSGYQISSDSLITK